MTLRIGLTLLALFASMEVRGDSPRLRQPRALALLDRGHWLYVANELSATISVIDTERGQLAGEVAVGGRLTDLCAAPDDRHLLAVDGDGPQLVLLRGHGPELRVVSRTPVSPYPVGLHVSADGALACVASLWSRQLTVIEFSPPLHGSSAKDPTAARRKTIKIG